MRDTNYEADCDPIQPSPPDRDPFDADECWDWCLTFDATECANMVATYYREVAVEDVVEAICLLEAPLTGSMPQKWKDQFQARQSAARAKWLTFRNAVLSDKDGYLREAYDDAKRADYLADMDEYERAIVEFNAIARRN
jgi:hypothetical protein